MPDTRSQRNDARGNYARFVGLGFTLILIFGLPTVVGFFLDRLAGTLPLFLLIGLAAGFPERGLDGPAGGCRGGCDLVFVRYGLRRRLWLRGRSGSFELRLDGYDGVVVDGMVKGDRRRARGGVFRGAIRVRRDCAGDTYIQGLVASSSGLRWIRRSIFRGDRVACAVVDQDDDYSSHGASGGRGSRTEEGRSMSTIALMQVSQDELREKILHTFESGRHAWVIPLHIGPIDISINKGVWFLFFGAAVTFLILFIGSRLLKDRPGAYQVIVEELYGFGRNLGGQVGEEGRKWFPYTLSLFVFILVLAALTFILTQFEGFRRYGAGTYLKSFAPPGLPLKPIMVPFMWSVEILGEFTKPLTLGMRLYANILAGHLIILVFLGLILYFGTFAAIVSVPLAVVFYAFEIFVAVLQAYIFAILTQVYIELAMFREDH